MKHLLISCFLCMALTCQADVYWQRSVTNYTRHTYKAANQNWMVEQHPNGWMYFANNKGLLEFDGAEWNTYLIENAKTRAVKASADGRIYVGGLGQFGYFVPDGLGGLKYVCLSDNLDKRSVGNIWKIHIVDDRVYFQSDRAVFYLEKNGTLEQVKHVQEISCSGIVQGKFYITSEMGLWMLNGQEFSLLPQTADATRSKVVGLLPFGNKVLVVSSLNGLFTYDGKELETYHSEADPFLRSNQLFCAAIRDSLLALGSVQDGVLLLNAGRARAEKISLANGLQNKSVLSMAFDQERNLWLGLDNGIDCIHLNSPLFFLYSNKSAIGSGYTSCFYQNQLYLGTNQGVYATENPTELNKEVEVSFVPGTEGQVWALREYDRKLFCGGANALLVIDGSRTYRIPGIRGVWDIKPLSIRPDVLVAGTYNGLYLLKKEEGNWVVAHKIEGAEYSAKMMFVEEMTDAIWVANKESGLYRMVLSSDLKKAESVKCYSSDRLPAGDNVYVSKVNNEVVVASRQGLFRYNQIKASLDPYTELEEMLDGRVAYTHLMQDEFHNIWYTTGGVLKLLRYNVSEQKYEKYEHESFLKDFLIEDFEHIQLCNDRMALIGSEEGFCLFRFRRRVNEPAPLNLQIRKVYLTNNEDSLVYGRSFEYAPRPLTIPYKSNSLRIEYSVNNYDNQMAIYYSCRLIGSGDEAWSKYGENRMKEYTDLKEGKYTFEVKTITDRNKEPVISSFDFEILPPWYRSWWAYGWYSIFAVLVIYYAYRRLIAKNKRLLRQKEVELTQQKQVFKQESEMKDKTIDSLKEENLQTELRFKSEELIRTTMNILRKNEMLQEIRKEAVGISHAISEENLPAIRRKNLRMISHIDTNIEHDDDLQAFQSTFDIIHHDFFKYLSEHFPDLNGREKMLCAYIKMNLMSKEIAPLLNISLRGVEISRYRLRKKLGLGEKDSLAEYLQRLAD